ncbi:MAG: hypothetical protein NVSMB44_07610 [Ktedonobacteraceae bacterium]
MVISLVMTDDQRKGAEEFARQRGWDGLAIDRILDMPSIFIGSTKQIAEQMRVRRERFGISYYIVTDAEMQVFAPVISAF